MRRNIKKYLIVDGYNIINAWGYLQEMAKYDLDNAREKLIDSIIEYSQYTGEIAIIVFDAYNVKNGSEKIEERNNITVVYTKEHQTADSYIEKFISELSRYDEVKVATNDYAEQQIILGKGASRVSSRELELYLEQIKCKIKQNNSSTGKKIQRNTLEEHLDGDILSKLEKIRRRH